MSKIAPLKMVLKDENRKPLHIIMKELVHCSLIEKEIPYYYFTSLLYKNNSDDYRNFIGHKKAERIRSGYFYKNGKNEKLQNKLLFGELLKESGISTPEILSHNIKRTMIIGSTEVRINDGLDLTDILSRLISSTKNKSIFIKPFDGVGGKHSFKFDKSQIYNNEEVTELFKLMDSVNFIFQETVDQHDSINQIYPNSINTIRVHTHFDRDKNEVNILSALMRFGTGGSVVDNGSSGGFFIPVNTDNWRIEGVGKSYLTSGGKTFNEHPDTGVKLNGTKLPYGQLIESKIIDAATLFENKLIGWDVGITNNGPIIIEGNENPHIIMAQMATGGLKNHPGFRKALSDFI